VTVARLFLSYCYIFVEVFSKLNFIWLLKLVNRQFSFLAMPMDVAVVFVAVVVVISVICCSCIQSCFCLPALV